MPFIAQLQFVYLLHFLLNQLNFISGGSLPMSFFSFFYVFYFFCVWFKSSPVAVGFCSLMKKDKIKFGKLNSVSKFVYLYLSTATAVCRQKICLRHFHSPLLLRMYFGHLLADFLGCLPASKCGLTGEGLKQRFCVTRSMVTSRTLAFTFLQLYP